MSSPASREPIFTVDLILDTFIAFSLAMAYYAYLTNIAAYAMAEFDASVSAAGLTAGLYVIGGLVSRVFLGKYIELVGRRKMLLLGIVVALGISVTYLYVPSLTILYLIRFVHGLAFGITNSCTADIAAKLVPASRKGEGMGYYYLGSTMALGLGPLLGIQLAAFCSYEIVFISGIALYAVALLLALALHVSEEHLNDAEVREARGFKLGELILIAAVPLSMANFIVYFAYSGVLAFITEYCDEIGFAHVASYYCIMVAVGSFLSRMTTGRILDRHGANVIVIPGLLLFALGMAIYSQGINEVLFLLSGTMMGYGVAMSYSTMNTVVINKVSSQKYGVAVSTFAAISDLGTGIGPTVLGIMIAVYGYSDVFFLCSGISLAGLCLYWVIHGHGETRSRSVVCPK